MATIGEIEERINALAEFFMEDEDEKQMRRAYEKMVLVWDTD